MMKTLLVEGWRGVCHSYALVNQYHLFEFIASNAIKVFHRDMPCSWTKKDNPSGIHQHKNSVVENIPHWRNEYYDALMRIYSPFDLQSDKKSKILLWMVTELGLHPSSFQEGKGNISLFHDGGGMIITPSYWSKERICSYGFDEKSIFVVPHGVDGDLFNPMLPSDRKARRTEIGYSDEHIVFFSISTPTWNKGLDLIVKAFAETHKRYENVRLLLKDQRSLYGVGIQQLIINELSTIKDINLEKTLSSICVISSNLTVSQLREAYGIADYYLSPYRAEGFNLPAIEAIACGTIPIVSRGGSTDDFCDQDNSLKIETRKILNSEIKGQYVDAYLEPFEDSLLDVMFKCAESPHYDVQRRFHASVSITEKFTWRSAARQIEALV